jgi:hypothetical protein
MTGFIVSVFSFQNRVSPKEAFEGLEPGEGKLSRPVLRGLGSREAARPLDTSNRAARAVRAIHIAIHNNVVYDVLPMTSGAVRPLLCR